MVEISLKSLAELFSRYKLRDLCYKVGDYVTYNDDRTVSDDNWNSSRLVRQTMHGIVIKINTRFGGKSDYLVETLCKEKGNQMLVKIWNKSPDLKKLDSLHLENPELFPSNEDINEFRMNFKNYYIGK